MNDFAGVVLTFDTVICAFVVIFAIAYLIHGD